MAKRRTRKQKESAKHQFTLSWIPSSSEAKMAASEANVNRQFISGADSLYSEKPQRKLSKNTGETINLASIKKDIVKSLALAALILASEVVLYLLWH